MVTNKRSPCGDKDGSKKPDRLDLNKTSAEPTDIRALPVFSSYHGKQPHCSKVECGAVRTSVTLVMNKLTFITVFSLCSYSSGSQTVEVQHGEEASLHCMSGSPSLEFWIRQINRTHVHCVSVLAGGSDDPKYCEGFDSGRFKMSRKSSTLFLTIKNVDSSDSGQYICGFYTSGDLHFTVISLQVKVKSQFKVSLVITDKSDETAKLLSGVLGGLTVVLVLLIIGLVVKIRKLQTGLSQSDRCSCGNSPKCPKKDLRDHGHLFKDQVDSEGSFN
ncbi:uncharacterized protein V6R79_025681 [Siganus canaliculatus]